MKSDVTSKNRISKKREEMSRLDELIKELCPNGVEYKELKDLCIISRGKVISKDYIRDNPGDFPVYSSQTENEGNLGNISTYDYDGEYLTWTTDGANAGTVFYRNTKFNVTNVCGLLKVKVEKITSKFLYYFLVIKAPEYVNRGMGNPKLMSNVMEKIKVPIPPLEIQEEIVRVLNNFSLLITELTSELTARKSQYSWYRDYLLKFENKIKIMKLEDLFELKNGYTPSKSNSEYWENGDVNWFKIEDINTNGRVLSNSLEKVNKKGIKGKLFPENALIISTSATIGEYALITKKFLCNQRFTCLITKEEYKELILPMFLKHYAYILSKKCKENIKIGNFPSVDMDKFKKFSIALPPLEVQKRIVEVLDNFEKICNDLNIGLPAEIEARQKQYEFYRNYLLTFEEKSRQAILACELASLRSKQQAQNLIKILQYVYGYVEVRLGDIGKVSMCRRILKSETNSIGGIPFFKIGTFGKKEDAYISIEKFYEYKEKYPYPKKGMILISTSGTIGRTVVFDGKPAYYQDSNIVWIDNDEERVLNKYLYYFYQTNPWKIDIGGTIERLYNENIEKTSVPLPPLEEQQRIVDILDRFDKLCNDISEGLPAEIEARQKQYEYYREKLLSFKKL